MSPSIHFATLASAVAVAAALSACGTPDPYGPNNYPVSAADPARTYPYGTYPAQQAGYVEYGRITNVSLVSSGAPGYSPNRTAAGGVIGAIVGGLVGNQIGQGTGRGVATVLGATAGAVVGSNVARNTAPPQYNSQYPVYRITVQTDSGQLRTFDVNATADLRPGDRVRIENGMIYLG